MKKVFLGGTYNSSTWRSEIIQYLDYYNIDYFNPIVDVWNEEAKQNEIRERQTCDFVLYTITPKMTGCYSIAEVVDDSNKRPEKTILVILTKDEQSEFDARQLVSLSAVASLVKSNGGHCFSNLKSAIDYICKNNI